MRSLAVSLALLAAGSSAVTAASAPSCAKGLYMVVARGSEEAPGTGVTGNLTSQIAAKVPGSQVAAVDYPATLDDYESSEGKGVQAMQQLLNAYGQACPSSKIAILGYSQVCLMLGGEVIPRDADSVLCRVPRSHRIPFAVVLVAHSSMTRPCRRASWTTVSF